MPDARRSGSEVLELPKRGTPGHPCRCCASGSYRSPGPLRGAGLSKRTRIRDLAISIRGDIALARWSWRLAEPGTAAAHTWFPGGAGYRKIRGKWQIVHEHAPVPLH